MTQQNIDEKFLELADSDRMSRPDPHGSPYRTPIKVGEVWENPLTGERATILELPWDNSEGRVVAELAARVGSRAVGEHRHPALVERFTVLEGQLTVKRNGQTSIFRQGEVAVVEAGIWHDWWNATCSNVRVSLCSEYQLHKPEYDFRNTREMTFVTEPAWMTKD